MDIVLPSETVKWKDIYKPTKIKLQTSISATEKKKKMFLI